MRRLSFLAVPLLLLAIAAPATAAGPNGSGNGAPSGSHYTLNIIGVPHDKNWNPKWNTGGRIFVDLTGDTHINLCESGYQGAGDICPKDGFYVIDANGTDGSALFALPEPDADANGTCTTNCPTVTTDYSIFVRALAGGGHAYMKLCGSLDGTDICNTGTNILDLKKTSPSKFRNVTAELLYLFDVTINGTHYNRVELFDPILQGYFWDYDNYGLKLAQLRFYACTSDIGSTGLVGSACNLTGN